jgi:hypothetical protein
MEKTYKPGITDSVLANEDLIKQRFVGFDGKYCKAGEKALGVCDATTDQNQLVPVALNGILLIETGGAVAVGNEITSDGQGRVIVLGTDQKSNGYALDASAGAGEIIRIARGI